MSMKQFIAFATLTATTALMAGYSELAYLYKDPRIMGMGGANIAVGGQSTSVFYNPAGLSNIKKQHGFVVDILGVGVEASDDFQVFTDDLSTAADSEDTTAVSEVLQKYSGQHFHLGASNYSALSKNSDLFAWSVGILAAADANLIPHGNGGANDLLETHSRVYGGIVTGFSKAFNDFGPGNLSVGLCVKFISQRSYEGGLGITEIIENKDDFGTYMSDTYEKESSGFGVDLGLNYALFPDGYWHPALGVSVLNIGSMGMDDFYGKQPMTVNVGASISPEIPFLEHFILAVDYVDLLNANETRFYEFDNTGNITNTTDFEDSDALKRLRVGVSAGVFDNQSFEATINAGMYQGNYTAGLDLEATIVKLAIATYEEEIGPEAGQLSDRRYMLNLGIGW